jgi:hypothetical protein
MELLGDVGHVEFCYSPFGEVLVSLKDTCMVCNKRTIGSEIIFDAPGGTPRDEAQVDAHFILFGDSANIEAR